MEKVIVFLAQTRKELRALDTGVRSEFGFALSEAQSGRTAAAAKPMKGNLRDVMEIVSDEDGDTYRAMYTTKFEDRVYVLDVFKKKSKSGKATPQADIDRIVKRLKTASEHYKEHPPE